MAEPRKVVASVTTSGRAARGKSQVDIEAQMARINRELYDRYMGREYFTTPDGREGVHVFYTQRNRELYRRASRAYDKYTQNIAEEVNPGKPDYETLWLTEEQRNRRVPRSVYMRNNRR